MITLKITPPTVLLREWLSRPQVPMIGAFALSGMALALAGWFVLRNLRHNEPGLKSPAALGLAVVILAGGFFGAQCLPEGWRWPVAMAMGLIAYSLFFFADRHRYIQNPQGQIVADRWEIALKFARFCWT